jgi:phosphatidylglycerophosphate synthase
VAAKRPLLAPGPQPEIIQRARGEGRPHEDVVALPLLPTVGLANLLTGLRGLGASYLIGRLVGGLATPTGLALGVFLPGVITDILDGQVARLTKTQSKLGQIADGEADFCLYLALTIILVQNAVLPPWVGIVMLLRFVIPFVAALVSYFLLAQPVCFGSTIWGKYAGLAQCLYFFVLLTPPQLSFLTSAINAPSCSPSPLSC